MTSEEPANRIKEALNFLSTISYSIANDESNKPKDRIDSGLVFLKCEAWLAKSEEGPLALDSLEKAIELT